jgi:hypothetical protein
MSRHATKWWFSISRGEGLDISKSMILAVAEVGRARLLCAALVTVASGGCFSLVDASRSADAPALTTL